MAVSFIKKRTTKVAASALLSVTLLSTMFSGSVFAITPSKSEQVARVTGASQPGETLPNPNHTDTNYQLFGTDLGIMWDKGNGEIFTLFGDSYGQGWGGNGAGPDNADWRSNLLAKSSDTNLADGLTFSTMIQDTPGHAKELLPAKRIWGDEWTVIPTAGVTVGNRHYIHYMSINNWGSAGLWQTNYSGIAYSDDNGQNWIKSNVRWNNTTAWDNKFQQAAFLKADGYVYMYGQQNGRRSDVYLARVPENMMLDFSAYRYWDGNGWSSDQAAAKPIFIGITGELSIVYNTHFNKYIMTYLNEHRWAIVMREASTPVGPWSGEKILTTAADYPGFYGGFIHPWSTNGTDLYYLMSIWGPYNTFLMHSTLSPSTDGSDTNMLSAPGFEDQDQGPNDVMAPWYIQGTGGIDQNKGHAHTGTDNGYVRNSSGWNAVKQRLVVQPNTWYTLKGWVRTSSNNTEGYFGARLPNDGPILGEAKFGSLPNYTEQTVTFFSGNNSYVEVYSGIWANGDTWMQLDDASVRKVADNLVQDPGFENQGTGSLTNPWYTEGNAGVDRNLGFAHSGSNNAFARYGSGWNAIKQEVFLEPNTNYTLTGYIRTSANNTSGYFGVKRPSTGATISEAKFGNVPDYTKYTVAFNSGDLHSVELYAGFWANGDTWIQLDDVSIVKS